MQSHLASLPKGAGPLVYTHLLNLLAGGRQAPAIVLPDEVLALADASPGDLDSRQLRLLGQLLVQSRENVGDPRQTLARLRAGTKHLGGADPKKRLAAARLLLAAQRVDEAQTYLPPLAESLRAKDAAVLNLHAACLQALGLRKQDKQAFRQAWDVTQTVLKLPCDSPVRREAMRRIIALMPSMPDDPVIHWLTEFFPAEPVAGLELLAEAAQQSEAAFAAKLAPPRIEALMAQQKLVRGLLDAAAKTPRTWSDALRMTALGWIKEAAYSVGNENGPVVAQDVSQGNDPSSGVALAASSYVPAGGMPSLSPSTAQIQVSSGDRVPPLPAKSLVPVSPDEAWCVLLDADMAWQMRRLTAMIAARSGDRPRTFSLLPRFVARDPALARQLAEAYLQAWTRRQAGQEDSSDDDRQQQMMQQFMMRQQRISGAAVPYYPSPSGQPQGGLSLSRAKQVRNLAALAELLGEFQKLKVPPLGEHELVSALDACHSPAEVYREEDLRSVFGDLAALSPQVAIELASAMRTKLAGQWRKPEVQEQAGTQRTDKDLVAEIIRGYELALRLLGTAAKAPTNVEGYTALATVYFDQAEFLYGQKADLKTYVAVRDRAFATYRKAAALYAEQLPGLSPERQSADVYRQWFQSSLGASDLAYLTRQDRPDTDEIDRIAAALHKLTGEAADRHLALFGQAVTMGLNEVPPQLKPHYIRQASRILGSHPSGQALRDKLAYYDDLLAEVRLHLAVDGPADVGHGEPFGVQLAIRYTAPLGRESSGFVQLLQKSYSRVTNREINYPKELEQVIGEKLGQGFDVQAVRFHDLKTTPRGFGRPGWQETPVAYLVLKAKTPAVDRIPSVHVDLEFNDGSGIVLLPIASQVVLLDARNDHPPLRPARELKVRQVLDDRRLAAGAAQMEIVATAKGLVPRLDQLLDTRENAVPGFKMVKVQDHGLEIKSMEDADGNAMPVCERRWQIDLEPVPGEPSDRFVFPKSVEPSIALAYQRYSDADIVDTAAEAPLSAPVLGRRMWPWIGAAIAAGLAVAAAAALVWRRIRRRGTARAQYRRPDPMTPFNSIVLLRRIAADEALPLSGEERQSLGATIEQLQETHFGRLGGSSSSVELTAVLDRWLAIANDGRPRTTSRHEAIFHT